jgi:hypothetical protein
MRKLISQAWSASQPRRARPHSKAQERQPALWLVRLWEGLSVLSSEVLPVRLRPLQADR